MWFYYLGAFALGWIGKGILDAKQRLESNPLAGMPFLPRPHFSNVATLIPGSVGFPLDATVGGSSTISVPSVVGPGTIPLLITNASVDNTSIAVVDLTASNGQQTVFKGVSPGTTNAQIYSTDAVGNKQVSSIRITVH